MEAQQVIVQNLPPTPVLWAGYIGMFLIGVAAMIVAIALLPILAQIKGMLGDVRGQLPELLNLGKATLGNVKVMSDDVKGTTHQATNVANRVLHLATSIVERLESPIVKSVGILTGLAAGLRALKGGNSKEKVVVVDKKRGFLGRK